MSILTFDKHITALIVIDPYNDFISEGGKVVPMLAKYGGRSLTKTCSHRVLETDHWLPDRVVIFEFPDMTALNT
jgi:uncharacterized protein (DUF1330 family)